MNWLQTWKDVSDKNSFMWNMGFTLLQFSNGRCLLMAEASSSPSLPDNYGILIHGGTVGLEVSISLGTKTYALGIGVIG